MTGKQKLIPSLNGLRALSIFIVMISHSDRSAGMPRALGEFLSAAFYGNIGVRMFFVISGFIITVLLLQELRATGTINFRAFYFRRLLRIFPPFYAFLIIVCFLKWAGLICIDSSNILVAFLYVENFKLAPVSNWFVGHSWSLSVEEQFYLLWPGGLYRLRKMQFGTKHIILVIGAGTLMRALYYKYTIPAKYLLAPFFMHADCLFIGCYAGYLYFAKRDRLLIIANRLNTFWLLAGTIAVWIAATLEYHPRYDVVFIPFSATIISGIAALFLVYFVLKPQSPGGKFLNTRFMDFAGRLSYSLYIWQQLFLGVDTATLHPSLHWMVRYPQNFGCAILAALVSFYCIEQPFLRLKYKYANKRSLRAVMARSDRS